jgi:hypothetical protein
VYYDACKIASYKENDSDDPIFSGRNSALTFLTSDDGGVTAATERMRISSAGKVGIGTTDPLSSFHVYYNLSGTNPPVSIGDVAGYDNPEYQPVLLSCLQSGLTAGNFVARQLGKNDADSMFEFFNYTGTTATNYWGIAHYGQPVALSVQNGGNVGIGKTNPATALDVTGTVTATNLTGAGSGITALNMDNAGSGTLAVARGGTGTTTSTGTGSVVLSNAPTLTGTTNMATLVASGNITSSSDRRIKKDIKRIEGALDKVTQIGGYTFTRTDDPHKDQRQAGIIAQEMLKVLPEVVRISEETGYYSVSYGNITALLIEALKEERIERLKLEERIACIENLLQSHPIK